MGKNMKRTHTLGEHDSSSGKCTRQTICHKLISEHSLLYSFELVLIG